MRPPIVRPLLLTALQRLALLVAFAAGGVPTATLGALARRRRADARRRAAVARVLGQGGEPHDVDPAVHRRVA